MTARRYWCRNATEFIGSNKEYTLRQLPYGCYHCENGREVLFDRNYAPLCERAPDMPARRADPCEWVKKIVREECFYVCSCGPTGTPESKRRQIAEDKLLEWGADMHASVMAEIAEGIHNSARFSWRKGRWIHPREVELTASRRGDKVTG
jgi:hypothetical protein